jgi:thiosulfate/3-mercaptopyruvate sulfurtransferase
MYTTLIDVQTLSEHVADPNWIVVDCRFSLMDTAAGQAEYEAGHIPGAVYAHLDDDLSGPPLTDNGRHPLPAPQALTTLFGRWGIDAQKQVVAYDANNGVFAARLWWMLRYMGHTAVAVLDGGWQAWQAGGLPTRNGRETNEPVLFLGSPQTEWLIQVDDVRQQTVLIDSRGPSRYRGEEEPYDAIAGHIPGAVNYYYQENWSPDGRYLSADQMRQKLSALLGTTAVEEATFYCGSGVSACVNLLALAHAGMGNGRLYVGSWSEWVRDASRPIATG